MKRSICVFSLTLLYHFFISLPLLILCFGVYLVLLPFSLHAIVVCFYLYFSQIKNSSEYFPPPNIQFLFSFSLHDSVAFITGSYIFGFVPRKIVCLDFNISNFPRKLRCLGRCSHLVLCVDIEIVHFFLFSS